MISVHVTQDDFIAGGRDPAKVFAPPIARAAGVDWILVHRGPLKSDSFEARLKQSLEEATSWFVRVPGTDQSALLPQRVQLTASILEYGTSHIFERTGKDEAGNWIVRRWSYYSLVRPFTFELPIEPVPRTTFASGRSERSEQRRAA